MVTKVKLIHFSYIIVVLHTVLHKMVNKSNRALVVTSDASVVVVTEVAYVNYRVIHKSHRDCRTRLQNNQDRHGRKQHINR